MGWCRLRISLVCFSLSTLIYIPVIYADDSIGYRYTNQLLDALHHCDSANYYMDVASRAEERVAILMNAHLADDEILRCQTTISSFQNEQNKDVKNAAAMVYMSTNLLRQHLSEFIKFLSEEHVSATQAEIDDSGAKILADLHADWKLLTESIAFDTYVLIDPAKEHDPSGPLPFHISKDERKWLQAHINQLFGEQIKIYREGKKRGEQPDLSAVVFGVMVIDNLLRSETYADHKQSTL